MGTGIIALIANAFIGAAVGGRKHLSRIKQTLGVEGAFQPLLLVQIDLGKHLAHRVALLDADVMLARKRPAKIDRSSAGCRRRTPLPSRSRRACWRHGGSAGADCRRRHGRRWQRTAFSGLVNLSST
jgi:hypothetical protein